MRCLSHAAASVSNLVTLRVTSTQQAFMLCCAGSTSAFMPGRRLRGSSNALDRLLQASPRAVFEPDGPAAELSFSGLPVPGQSSAAGVLRPPSPRPPAYRAAAAISSPISALPARPAQSAFAGAAASLLS